MRAGWRWHCAGCQHEVVFEVLLVVTVVNQVDPGIDVLVFDLTVAGDVRDPM